MEVQALEDNYQVSVEVNEVDMSLSDFIYYIDSKENVYVRTRNNKY